MHFYSGLSVLFYDYFFPEHDNQETDFYAQHISLSPSPALEVGCGSGRLLLPLLKRGLHVEGLDMSPEMLAQCREKAQSLNLKPILYEQRMQDLSLSKQYGCIFSALGTFQQISARDDAQRALHQFYNTLLPGGRLIIYLYLPWHDAPPFGEWYAHETVSIADREITVYEKSVHDPQEQLVYAHYRYELKQHNVVIKQEEKDLTIRWYSRFEFEMMLEKAGFKEIAVSAGYDDSGPFDLMLFCAKK